MRKPNTETIEHLKRLLKQAGSYRATAKALGFSPEYGATIYNIISGHSVGSQREDNVRHRLNLPPRNAHRISDIPTDKLRELLRNRIKFEIGD